ncbi:hypothetical protein GCM10022393_40320 [Aquimarina addita]|uniref:Por secretion system C-terminal sorting domain-containing protein n=1 Tax=Aquimarina addita TaxID=870485 RepID=A0ABP6UW94_9FLAO
MKNSIKLLVLTFILVFSNTVFAAGKVSVAITNSSMVNVSLANVAQGEKLFLKDYYGVVLFDATLDASAAYQKYFNFSDVKNGLYFIETESEFEVKVTPVLKNGKGVSLVNNSAVTIFKPQVKVDENKVSVMLINTKKSPVNFSIYDQNNILLVEEKAINDKILERIYDFFNVKKGTYFLYFSLEDRTFMKEVTLF